MKSFYNSKWGMMAALLCAVIPTFSSCQDDIDVGAVDTGKYETDGIYGYVRNVTGARDLATITLFGSATGTAQVYMELSEPTVSAVNAKLKIDKSVLDKYNQTHGTSYALYPAEYVSFDNSGSVTVAANQTKSEAVTITINAGGEVGTTYALPVTAEMIGGEVSMSKNYESYIYLVKTYAAIPDSDKGTGIKNIIYMEVNDENILNVGEYTMKTSGKPFFDVVNIFAANINYNSETGRVYVNCNDNVSYILRNAELFIRPLQAKGIKVCLTILGNHDEAGVANLSAGAAADFARELKQYLDIYGLDGIDFDDEYSEYKSNPSAGFVTASRAASARLVYECRQVMPDKIISFYDYGNYIPAGTVEGIEIGELLDYSYWGAYANWNDQRYLTITGLDKSKYCPSSFNLDYTATRGGYSLDHAQRIRNEGFGVQMFYNLKPRNYDYSSQFNQLGNVLFDDDVVWTGVVYNKASATGTANFPSYESYLGTWTLTPATGLFYYTPGPWWDYTDEVSFTLRIEENEYNKSYKVYGWGEGCENLPFIMNYNDFGRVEINLPQTVTEEIEGGMTWTFVARTSYRITASAKINTVIEPAFQGIYQNGSFTINAMKNVFSSFVTMSPVSNPNATGSTMLNIKGGSYQDCAYAPFTLKQ